MEIIKASASSIAITMNQILLSKDKDPHISYDIKPRHEVFLETHQNKVTKKDGKLREGKHMLRKYKGKKNKTQHEWRY